MRSLILVLVLLVSSGCSSIYMRMTELHIDPSLPTEVIEEIISAVDEVCERTGECVTVTIGKSGSQWIRESEKCGDRRARTLLSAARRPRIKLCSFEHVHETVMHELGHAIAANPDHIDKGSHVMHEDVMAEHLTLDDVYYFQRL